MSASPHAPLAGYDWLAEWRFHGIVPHTLTMNIVLLLRL